MEVFVFDLDFTLWNAGETWCSETNPQYLWEDANLLDRSGRLIRLSPETRYVLESLKKRSKTIVAASRTHQPEWANQLLQLFDIDKYFDVKEIYPGSKLLHLKRIAEKTKCPFCQIVFFDDEERNIVEVKSLGEKQLVAVYKYACDASSLDMDAAGLHELYMQRPTSEFCNGRDQSKLVLNWRAKKQNLHSET